MPLKLRMPLAIIAVTAQTACSISASDYVSYALWNRSTDHAVEDCILRSAGTPPILINASSHIDALPSGAPGWNFGGATSMPGTKHEIPARVHVSWRLPPHEGQEMYRGDLVGPFDVDIHALIPADVRAKVRNSSQFKLEIAFAVGREPVTLRWRLIEWTEGGAGRREVRRGGDWSTYDEYRLRADQTTSLSGDK